MIFVSYIISEECGILHTRKPLSKVCKNWEKDRRCSRFYCGKLWKHGGTELSQRAVWGSPHGAGKNNKIRTKNED